MTEEALSASDYSLIKNAERYEYDPRLDPIADSMDAGDTAWTKAHPVLQDRAGIYRDLRTSYRTAVRAGLIPNDKEQR